MPKPEIKIPKSSKIRKSETQSPTPKVQHRSPEFQMQNLKQKTIFPVFKTQSPKRKVYKSKRVQSSESQTQHPEAKVPIPKPRIQNPNSKAQMPKFKAQSLQPLIGI